jgi:hypothetical protein
MNPLAAVLEMVVIGIGELLLLEVPPTARGNHMGYTNRRICMVA